MQKTVSSNSNNITRRLKINIVSPERVLFEGDIVSVSVPGISGNFEIYKDHAPIISVLTSGKVVCKGGSGKEFSVDAKSGFVEMKDNYVSICIEVN